MASEIEVTNLKRLLFIGNLSIFMIGLGFAVRATIAANLQVDIYDQIDISRSTAMVGEALGLTFTGFALTLLFGSALVDWVGAKCMLMASATSYIIGGAMIIGASLMPISSTVEAMVLIGMLLTGLGWGAVEAASNPMVAALDSENKTHRLNVLHAWWPAGIVVGGLLGLLINALSLPWQLNLLILILPALLMAFLVMREVFPVTERVASGISYADMFKEVGRQPMFILFWICMWMTAAAELAPGQWVDITLSRVVGMKGIILLIYVSALMFVMRHFAGTLAKRISPIGVLLFSSILAAIGLYCLSLARTPITGFLAATVWAVGVCFLWPTMLAEVADRFRRGGALFLGLLGFAGGLSIQFMLPTMGKIFDSAKLEAAGGVDAFEKLSDAELDSVLLIASVESFQSVAFIPLILVPIFAAIWWWDSRSSSSTHMQNI